MQQSLSSVYSSKIEGENIDFDSYFKHKVLDVEYQTNYVQRADDLYEAYEFIIDKPISPENVKLAHTIITRHLLPSLQQGVIRKTPMFVLNEEDKIEYVAADPEIIDVELSKLFQDIHYLLGSDLEPLEVFYFAAYIHLVFVKIHPFQDGNGRTARLLEKWFLVSKLGRLAHAVKLEKNYYQHLKDYYRNIRVLGLEYDDLDYGQCLGFLSMTVNGLEV